MKLVRVAAVVVAGGLLLSACGGQSDEERAQVFAIKACEIPTDDGGEPVKNDEGIVEFDASRDPSASFNIDTGPISELQSIYDGLTERSANGQAASQLDSTWRSLADGLTERTAIAYKALSLRKKGQKPFNDPNMAGDVETYNALIQEETSQCSGLAALLSE